MLLIFAFLSGCSGFEKKWKAAAGRPVEVNDIQGRWKGTWKSEKNGHSGGLRAVITRQGEDTYNADFHATYGWIFRFGYSMAMTAQRGDETFTYFTGSADLGKLAGGVYEYDGKASGEEFFCNYRSKGDHGHFRMTRPDVRPGVRFADAPAER